MGKSLYDGSAAARALYDEASGILGWDLKKICFEGPETELTQTKVCQPALFVHGLAVVAALREAGKLPEVKFALGLSLGEVTALTAAGVFDFATGLKVVAERGRLMQLACEQTVGGMAAIIGEERAKVAELCREFAIEAANFNAPGQIIVSGDKSFDCLVYDLESKKEIARLKGHKQLVASICFSPDGKKILTGADDRTIRLWDAEESKELLKIDAHAGYVRSARFFADGKRAISVGYDHVNRVWDLGTGRNIASFESHERAALSVAVTADGKTIFSGSADSNIVRWQGELK